MALRQPLVAERELAAHVDERDVALHRVRRDRDALDELVRIALEEHAVLERRRLAFVGVDDEVARERVGRQERPLLRGREARAAAAAQARQLHLLLHVGRRRPCASTARSDVVRARRERAVDRPRVVGTVVQPLRDDPGLAHGAGDVRQRGLPTRCAPGARPTCSSSTISSADARRHVLVELVVHLQRGRTAARGEALDLFDGDVGLRRVALLEMVEHLGTAGDETRDVRAHRHDELPARTPLEHRVEGARPEHVGRGACR